MIHLNAFLSLHPLTPADHPAHATLMRRIYPPAFAYLWPDGGEWYLETYHGREAFEGDLAEDNCPYYHVHLEGKPIGILWLRLHAPDPDHPELPGLKLERIYLDPSITGRGIGSYLMNYVKAAGRRLGKALVWLERMDSNESTIRFYRRQGFTRGGAFSFGHGPMYAHLRDMHRLAYFLQPETRP